tara:strand:+ start:571 stop:861 length:291 start_codon:yes stop_codon:yes gene_type:complete
MKKVKAIPFQSLYDVNENMYQNVNVISKRSREILSENVLDLNKLEEGFETTDEIQEVDNFDPDQEKSIVTAARDFMNNDIDWEIKKEEESSEEGEK